MMNHRSSFQELAPACSLEVAACFRIGSCTCNLGLFLCGQSILMITALGCTIPNYFILLASLKCTDKPAPSLPLRFTRIHQMEIIKFLCRSKMEDGRFQEFCLALLAISLFEHTDSLRSNNDSVQARVQSRRNLSVATRQVQGHNFGIQ